ncbi:MAG TPA: iron-sulfur cluster assembly protein [Chitinophagaceae bacterium]|jgi:FeS assembly SUF system protein|nr:iron-sulfur cluster assembly protein [Chitinophagaceae bacterium]
MIQTADVVHKLQTIYDPEIPVNIYDLGLIYRIEPNEDVVSITMTLTTATCPAAAFLPEEVMNAVRTLEGVRDVHVHITYEPKWNNRMMSEEARRRLGFR